MAHQKTAVAAEEMFAGEQLYQVRARKALPSLVRQALAQAPIHYGQLAAELGMPNPRNMNFVLGSVGVKLNKLRRRWGEQIPPIQSLAIEKWSGVPGKGFILWSFQDVFEPCRSSSSRNDSCRLLPVPPVYLGSIKSWRNELPAAGHSLRSAVKRGD